jgi:hypothetical protein
MRHYALWIGLLAALCALPVWADGGSSSRAWKTIATPMSDQRWAPAAVLLADGHTALVAGGYSYATGRCVASADLFDERTLTFRPCARSMNDERDFATATLLSSGQVLIAGGFNTHTGSLDTAEIYDPPTDTFRPLASRMSRGRELFQATPLADGRVLLTGGLDLWTRCSQNSADVYDPKTETFTPTAAPMAQDRFGQAAVRLLDGRVLIVGGKSVVLGVSQTYLASAEIYDPKTNRFSPTKSPLHVPRDRPTATLLPDGRVLIVGGQDEGVTTKVVEIFDPITETFTVVPSGLAQGRMAHSAVCLPDGSVLVAGGWSAEKKASIASCELYQPSLRDFVPLPPLPQAVLDAGMVVFSDGGVLVAGGKTVDGTRAASSSTGYFQNGTEKHP